jgi:hypothetical protein
MADLTAADVSVTPLHRHGRRIVEGVKEVYADVTFGDSSLTYPAGGIPMPAAGVFGLKEIFFASVEQLTDGYVYIFDRTNHKLLRMYGDYSNVSDGVLIDGPATAPASTIIRLKLAGN